ncbi:uncharacterized protein LOC116601450 [Nematostella vectensis]|uniref:uncharacterized protein LOC116601450 n=1 Tax=Nematostella vectensis TaxID=45351 RepID=UPI0020775403|nr:uncharacterized protein LOC116601450 [Nematostella vectensis]
MALLKAPLFLTLYVITFVESQSRKDLSRNTVFKPTKDEYLDNSTFKTVPDSRPFDCSLHCLADPDCQSTNYHPPTRMCELCNHTFKSRPGYRISKPGYIHFDPDKGSILSDEPCRNVECKNGGMCYPVDSPSAHPPWKCVCQINTTGMLCEQWIGVAASSCKDAFIKGCTKDTSYILNIEDKSVETFCHLTAIDGCGDGGWTLAMKVNGSKTTFPYESSLWTDKSAYNPSAGLTGFDNQETKLPSYWATPFTKICIGFKVGDTLKNMTIPYTATSLYDVIADGTYRGTSIGKTAWRALIAGSSMQGNCNRQGFNVLGRLRIGIMSNQENDCITCDTHLGIGGDVMIAGNRCGSSYCDNGPKNIKAMGYLLLQ